MRKVTRLTALPTTATWTCAKNTSWRRINNGSTLGQHFVEFILSENAFVSAKAVSLVDAGTGSGNYIYDYDIGVNSTSSPSATQGCGFVGGGDNYGYVFAVYEENTAAGKIAMSILERNTSTVKDAIGTGSDGRGMVVRVEL